MKNKILVLVMMISLSAILSGCSSFWGGTAVGAVGVGAVDAISAKNQIDKLDADYKAGNITKEEYDIRLDQIKKGSLIY